ncbi:hypothetical protein H5410_059825 [Solanum commersonii]|uniref:Uncharacterized protein n=1 Tax=Solanum commersonii TaxID=4109 RepID=A0A9J5W3E9_SOLCO|nr:hypothetical protein H5410_059825 [Solanum commersonii]
MAISGRNPKIRIVIERFTPCFDYSFMVPTNFLLQCDSLKAVLPILLRLFKNVDGRFSKSRAFLESNMGAATILESLSNIEYYSLYRIELRKISKNTFSGIPLARETTSRPSSGFTGTCSGWASPAHWMPLKLGQYLPSSRLIVSRALLRKKKSDSTFQLELVVGPVSIMHAETDESKDEIEVGVWSGGGGSNGKWGVKR